MTRCATRSERLIDAVYVARQASFMARRWHPGVLLPPEIEPAHQRLKISGEWTSPIRRAAARSRSAATPRRRPRRLPPVPCVGNVMSMKPCFSLTAAEIPGAQDQLQPTSSRSILVAADYLHASRLVRSSLPRIVAGLEEL